MSKPAKKANSRRNWLPALTLFLCTPAPAGTVVWPRKESNWKKGPRWVSPGTPDAQERGRNIGPADKPLPDGRQGLVRRFMVPTNHAARPANRAGAGREGCRHSPRRYSSAASPTPCTPGAISSTQRRPRIVARRPRFWAWADHCTPFTSTHQAVTAPPLPRIQEWPLFRHISLKRGFARLLPVLREWLVHILPENLVSLWPSPTTILTDTTFGESKQLGEKTPKVCPTVHPQAALRAGGRRTGGRAVAATLRHTA